MAGEALLIAANVLTLKKMVPANWTTEAHHPSVSGWLARSCSKAAVVKKIEPVK